MQDQHNITLRIEESELRKKLTHIKAWLFDWDGVFNDGHKGADKNNTFSERDSMGTNMLRYAHYLRTKQQARIAIITGASNAAPINFGTREHFHAIIPSALYKRDVVEMLLNQWGIKPEETAFFFDDILDLNVCEIAGLRIQVRYPASESFNRYVDRNNFADIITMTSGRDQAVRHVADYLIDLQGQTDDTISGRMHMSASYKQYFEDRQKIETKIFTREELLNNPI